MPDPSMALPWGLLALALLAHLALWTLPLDPWLQVSLMSSARLLSGLWLLWRGLILWHLHSKQQTWRVSPPWTLAETARWSQLYPEGLFLGKGFPWSATHTQALELGLVLRGALPVGAQPRLGHPALHAVGLAEEEVVGIPTAALRGHVAVAGTTGSGKTRLLEVLARGLIRRKHGATVVIDPKGDRQLLYRCAWEAQQQGRRFALLTLTCPAQSATMNVLGSAQWVPEVSTRIRALMPSGGGRANEPFFEEYALAVIERIAPVLQALGVPWTLQSLYQASVPTDGRERLLMAYLALLGIPNRSHGPKPMVSDYRKQHHLWDPLADMLIDDFERERQHFDKVTSSLTPAFRGVVGDPLGPLLSAGSPTVTWQQVIDEEMVLFVSLGSLLLGDIAHRVGRVLLQDLIGYLGRRYAYDADIETATPLAILIDECGDVLYPMFANALNKGGGAQAQLILAMQSLADFEVAVGKAIGKKMLDNINTRIWMRLADDETAEHATEGLGTCMVELPETSRGVGYGGMGGLTGHASRRLVAERKAPLLRPEWLKALPTGEALMRSQGQVVKVRIPLLEPIPDEAVAEALMPSQGDLRMSQVVP